MSTDVATEDDYDYDNMSTEYVAAEDDYDYDNTSTIDYSDLAETDYDDDELENLINFKLLKVSAQGFKTLTSEEKVQWVTAHFIIQKHQYMFKPRIELSKVEENSKEEEESKVEKEDDDVEEESKVAKTNDDAGGSGPRGTSWKRSSKPCV